MNFFGGSNCGEMDRGCGGGFDCCTLIFLLLLLQNCGCGFGGMKGGEICIDCKLLLILFLLSNCGCGCHNDCK